MKRAQKIKLSRYLLSVTPSFQSLKELNALNEPKQLVLNKVMDKAPQIKIFFFIMLGFYGLNLQYNLKYLKLIWTKQ